MTGRDRRNTKQAIAARMEAQRQRPPASTPQPAPAPAPEQQRPAPRPAPASAPYVAPVKPSPADLEVQALLTQMSEADDDLTPIQALAFELFRDLARDLVLHMTHPGSLDALINRLPALGTAARLGTRNALLAAES